MATTRKTPKPATPAKQTTTSAKSSATSTHTSTTSASTTAKKVSTAVSKAKPQITAAQTESANKIVRRYALYGTATGLIPAAGLDVIALTAVQTKMIKDLAEVYGYDISENLLSTALTNGITSLGSRVITGMLTGLAKSVAPLKSLVGGALSAAFAGFITAETGKIYQARMEEGVDPANIKVGDIIDHIYLQLKEGKFNPTNVKGQFGYLLNQ